MISNRHRWPPLTILCVFFYRQRVSMALQRAQATSILRCVVIASEGFSKLIIFLGFSYSFWYASYNWWGIWNMICSFVCLWPALGFVWFKLGFSFFLLCFPLFWVFCFIEFAKVSSIKKVWIFWPSHESSLKIGIPSSKWIYTGSLILSEPLVKSLYTITHHWDCFFEKKRTTQHWKQLPWISH